VTGVEERRRHQPTRSRGPYDRPFMSSFTETIDLSTLHRRLAQEALREGGRVDFEPRLYGRPRPLGDDGDAAGTQTIPRRPRPEPRRPSPQRRRWERGSEDGLDDLSAAPDERDRGFDRGYGLDDLSGPHPAADADEGSELGEFGSNKAKALWTIVDQIASAASNAAINFLVAREVTASEFGAFAIAFTVFALMVGFARASACGPLGIRYADASPAVFRSAAEAATGASLVLGIIGGGFLVAIGGLMSGAVGENLVAIGIVMPALLTQDAWRYTFFAQGRPAAATLNDMVWVVVMAIGIYFVMSSGSHSAIPLVLAWGAAAGAAAIVGIVQTGSWPAPARVLEWFSVHRDIVGYMSGEYITVQGAQQASTLLVAGLGTTSLVGALRGAQTLLGPTSNVATALVSFAVPEFARRRTMPAGEEDTRRVRTVDHRHSGRHRLGTVLLRAAGEYRPLPARQYVVGYPTHSPAVDRPTVRAGFRGRPGGGALCARPGEEHLPDPRPAVAPAHRLPTGGPICRWCGWRCSRLYRRLLSDRPVLVVAATARGPGGRCGAGGRAAHFRRSSSSPRPSLVNPMLRLVIGYSRRLNPSRLCALDGRAATLSGAVMFPVLRASPPAWPDGGVA
jgi:hypothetical protein